MEIFELKYFLAVAKTENIHRASETLNVSPPSLSKAISRLEGELGQNLFLRQGRNIKLTDAGRFLQKRASEIVQIEEATRVQILGQKGTFQAIISGPEVLLSRFGVEIAEQTKKRYPLATFAFQSGAEDDAFDAVSRGDAHLALTTTEPPSSIFSKPIADASFVTCVGKGHPLFAQAAAGKPVAVEKALEYPFASPSSSLLGRVGLKQSLDGWRDDRFPRIVAYRASSLKLLETLLVQGRALAYLPDYYVKNLPVAVLKITGCSYSCVQKIRLSCRDPKQMGWIHQLF